MENRGPFYNQAGGPSHLGDDPTVILSAMTEAEQLNFLQEALESFNSTDPRLRSLPGIVDPINQQGGISSIPSTDIYMVPTPIDGSFGPTSSPEAAAVEHLATDPDRLLREIAGDALAVGRSEGKKPSSTSKKSSSANESREMAQLRAREAQRRFRQRQKERRSEMETQLDSLTAEIEKEKLHREVIGHKNLVLENILEYKDEQVSVLKQGYKQSLLSGEDDLPPGPADYILPEHLVIMEETTTPGAYNLEKLMRYTPAGHAEHLGPDGFVKEPPPFEKVVEDWADLVDRLRKVLNVASNGLAHPEFYTPGASLSELSSENATAATATNNNNNNISEDNSQLQSSDTTATASSSGRQHIGTSTTGDFIKPSDTPLNTSNNTSNRGSDVIDGHELVAPDVTHPAVATLWHKEGHLLSQVAAKMAGIDQLEEGLSTYMCAGVEYKFSGVLLKRATMLLHTLGMLGWQQSVVFPDNMIKLSSTRLDTAEPSLQHRLEDIDHWRSVIRGLDLRKEQLEEIVAAHRTFVAAVRPVHRERATIMQHLKECSAFDGSTEQSVQSHIQKSIELGEAASALTQNIRKEYTAWMLLTGNIIKTLDFPVQRSRLMTVSWPYWPQTNILGTCAALELGINPLEYSLLDENTT